MAMVVVVVAGCGYHLSKAGYVNGNLTRVAVTLFDNNTAEGTAGVCFTNELIREITAKTGTQVVDDADHVIAGTVTSITISDLSRSSVTTVMARQVTAMVDVKLTDANGDILWAVTGCSANETYSVASRASDNGVDEASKRAAVNRIAQRVAERLVNQMTLNF